MKVPGEVRAMSVIHVSELVKKRRDLWRSVSKIRRDALRGVGNAGEAPAGKEQQRGLLLPDLDRDTAEEVNDGLQGDRRVFVAANSPRARALRSQMIRPFLPLDIAMPALEHE